MKIRSKTIAYASMKKKKTQEKEHNLQKSIKEIETKEEKNRRRYKIPTRKKNQELILLREKRMEGVLLGSKARWVAEGEKITKYFCSLEKRNFISKHMKKMGQFSRNPMQLWMKSSAFMKGYISPET